MRDLGLFSHPVGRQSAPTGRAPAPYGFEDKVFTFERVKDDFSKWLYGRVNPDYAKSQIRYLSKYAKDKSIATPRDVYEIRGSATSKKKITVVLRNLLNYAEEFDLIDDYKINKMRKVLKTVKSGADNYVPPTSKLREIYLAIDNPQYDLLFRILAYSGLRVIEGINFLSNYNPKRLEEGDNFVRYPLFAVRHSKKVYYVYLPASMKEELKQMSVSLPGFKNYLSRRGLSPKYLRKWNYNFLIMHNVPESVADFLQGRAAISIGSMHYLAKVKQADFWYSKITDELESALEQKEESPKTVLHEATASP